MDMKTQTTADVETLTQQGTELFHQGKLSQAVVIFEDAYRQAIQLNNSLCVCNSAFNLGAVYIANQKPDKGLEMLNNAWRTCGDIEDGTLKADLYYNYGLAYELQNNHKEAVKYLELALEEYQAHPDKNLTMADLAAKIANIDTLLNNAPQAARNHQVAAALYAQMQMANKHMEQLCKEATQLMQGGKEGRAMEVADSCMVACQNIKDKGKLSHIYNELGLVYSQCNEYEKAATCFEMAHPLCQLTMDGSTIQAVILQNLGGTYNTLKKYQEALHFHEQAAVLHAAQGNRKCQGKCFLNLAYAHSQLNHYDEAGEFYLHALQAAKDTGSKHDQWQAMEGIAAVAFHENRLERAKTYFTRALETLKASPGESDDTYDRIAAKLRDVCEYLMMQDTMGVGNGQQVPAQILINDEPRPPTREEQQQMEELRQWRQVRKIEREFDVVAKGIGEYVSDSDYSMRHHRGRSRYQSLDEGDEPYDEVDAYPVSHWSSRTRPQTFRGIDTLRKRSKHDGHRSDTAVSYENNNIATRHQTGSERKDIPRWNTYQRSFSGGGRQPILYDSLQSTNDECHLHQHGNVQSERSRHHSVRKGDEDRRCDHMSDLRRSEVKKRSCSVSSSDSSDSRSSLNSELARYAVQLGEGSDTPDKTDDSEGNSSDLRDGPIAQPEPLDDSSRYLPNPPPVPKHLTPPSRNQLIATYEKPISTHQHADGKMTGNYFRVDSAVCRTDATGQFTLSSNKTVEDDNDPTYMTIHSVNRTDASYCKDGDVMPSTSHEMAPPVPQRHFGPSSPDTSTGLPYDLTDPELGELHLDSQVGQEREHEGYPLPSRKKIKKKPTSAMCTVM